MNIRIIAVLLVSLLFYSCSQPKTSKKKLLGTWTMTNVQNPPGEIITDKSTFFENDSVLVEIYLNGKRQEHYSSAYRLDSINHTLEITFMGKSQQFEIVKLTETELEIKNPESGKIAKSVRASR